MAKLLESAVSALVPITHVMVRYPILTFSGAVFCLNLVACAWMLSREAPTQRLPKLRHALSRSAGVTAWIVLVGTSSLLVRTLSEVPSTMLQGLLDVLQTSVLVLVAPLLTLTFWIGWHQPIRLSKKLADHGEIDAGADAP